MLHERCETCRFGHGATERRVLCRRFPPTGSPFLQADVMLAADGVTNADLMHARTAWPVTSRSDWCGEYKERRP